jgi:hypothetical protein
MSMYRFVVSIFFLHKINCITNLYLLLLNGDKPGAKSVLVDYMSTDEIFLAEIQLFHLVFTCIFSFTG